MLVPYRRRGRLGEGTEERSVVGRRTVGDHMTYTGDIYILLTDNCFFGRGSG